METLQRNLKKSTKETVCYIWKALGRNVDICTVCLSKDATRSDKVSLQCHMLCLSVERHHTKETGLSPFELLFGLPVRGSTEIWKLAMTRKKYVEMSVIENVINFKERLSEMIVIVCENLTDKQLNMKSRCDSNTRKHHFPLVMKY
jgi:hypothetical protein